MNTKDTRNAYVPGQACLPGVRPKSPRAASLLAAFILCAIGMLLLRPAQAGAPAAAGPLLVDFNSTTQGGGPNNEAGFQPYDAAHENSATFVTQNYGVLFPSGPATVSVTPDWPNTTANTVRQAIDRGAGNDANWLGNNLDLLTDWLGTDTRAGNGDYDGATGTPTYLTLTLGGLPAATYDWRSWHHDTEHMHTPFVIELSTDGGTTFAEVFSGAMTDSTPGGNPDSGAARQTGDTDPDPNNLPSTATFSFDATGADVVLRFTPLAQAPVHTQFFGINGFELAQLPPSTLGNGLVNYWDFDQQLVDWAHVLVGSSSSVADDGNFDGINGTGGISFGAGLFGDAIDQDGAAGAAQNNGHVRIDRSADTLFGANATNPASPSTVTTSLWVQTSGFDIGWQTLLAHGEGNGFRIARQGGNPVAAYAGGSGDIAGGPDIGPGTGWHHVVAISEGGVSTRLWVDGGLVATGGAPNIDDNRAGGTLNMLIGANPDTGAQNREWWGQLDDVAQWNRVLTDAEIAELFGGGPVTAVPLSGLLGPPPPPTLGAGFDLFHTPAGSSHADIDLDGPGPAPPIRIEFEGNPDPLAGLLGPSHSDTDTIVQRLDRGAPEELGQPATVPIELIALSLQSVDPVDIGGTLFDATVIGGSLLGESPSPPGQMDIFREDQNGGLYDAVLPVEARLIFTEVGNPTNQIVVPFNDIFTVIGAPWSDLPGPMYPHSGDFPSGGFHPGVVLNTETNCTEKELTIEEALLAEHGIVPAMKTDKWVQLPQDLTGENIASNIDWRTVPPGPPVIDPNKVLADDFISDGRPITSVQWWGSYFDPDDAPVRGGDGSYSLSVEDSFVISFFSGSGAVQIPGGPAQGIAAGPGQLLGTYIVSKDDVWVQPTAKIGWDDHPLWQYQINLADAHLEHASPLATQESFNEIDGEVYWISIVATNGHDLVEVSSNPVVLTAPVDVYKLDGATGGDPGGGEGAAPSRFFGTDGTDGIRGQIQAAIDTSDPALNQNTHPDTLIAEGETPNPAQNDSYRLRVNGEIIVDNNNGIPGETIDLTFTLRNDDGGQLRIFGQDFTGTAGDGRTFLEDIGGDIALTADFFTGNTNALGHISLVEGTYQWEGFMFEGGGGSRFELQVALGTKTGFDGDFFVIDDFIPPEPWIFVDNGDPIRTDHYWGWHTANAAPEAPTISVNLNSVRDAAAELGAAEAAGAPGYVTSGWNNFNDIPSGGGPFTETEADIDSPVAGQLSLDSGAPSGSTITWSSNNSWNTNNGTGNPDNKLMNGYLDNSGGQPLIPIDITGLPTDFQSLGYSVVAYFGSDGNNRTGTVGLAGSDTFSYATFSNQGGGFPGIYTQTTDTAGGNPQANFAVWENQSSADVNLLITRGSSNSGFHGVQVIQNNPNPWAAFNRSAVMGNLLMPGTDWVYTQWTEIDPQHNASDMAFVLYSSEPDIPPNDVPPVIEGAKDIVVSVPTGGTATVSYAGITATDDVDGPIPVTCTPPDTTAFPIGVTTVTCTATDSSGNTAVVTFDVIVLEIQSGSIERTTLAGVSFRGDAAPGPGTGTVSDIPAGATLNSFSEAYLNNSSGILLQANLSSAGTNNVGVFSNASGAFESLGVKNSASPSGPLYRSFRDLALADDGIAAYKARTAVGDAHVSDSGQATTLLVGSPPPGLAGAPIVRSVGQPALSGGGDLFSPAGLRLFTGFPIVTTQSDTLIWSGIGGSVAREGEPAADLPAGVSYGHLFGRVVANDTPEVAFAGNLIGAGSGSAALWSGDPAALTVVAQRSDVAPDTGGALFGSFHAESISPSGTVVFRSSLKLGGGVSSSNNDALFTDRSGSLELVAREGDIAPCAPGDVEFDRFSSLFIDDGGSIVFSAFLKGGTVNSANDGSVWRSDSSGELHLIAREGDLANNTDGAIHAQLEVVATNNTGGVLIQGRLVPGLGDTTTANGYALWRARDASEPVPELVIRRNDTRDVGGVLRTITGLSVSYVTNGAGGTGGYGRVLNDTGETVTSLTLTGGITGVFTLP